MESNEKIGTIDAPENYFRGVAKVRWGPFGEGDAVVLFTGSTNRTAFVLGGSLKNVIGAPGAGTVGYVSTTPFLIEVLCRDLQIDGLKDSEINNMQSLVGDANDYVYLGIDHTEKYMKGPVQNVEFVAKRLLFETDLAYTKRALLLGTPIYVALAD